MKLSVTLAATLIVGAVTALPAAAQSTTDVDVQDNQFVEADITIDAGDMVQWTSSGSNPHTITASDGSFDSHPGCPPDFGACMGNGDTFSETFTEAGTFTYYCKIHGSEDGSGMAGTITVMAADSTASPSPSESESESATVTGSLDASDQSGDGSTVAIESATINGASGFVVIHADGDGSPGPVIGHAAISEGTSTNFAVTLDEPLGESATVWPMLHLDAGEVGTYEFPGADGPVSDDDGVITFPIEYTVSDEEVLPTTGTSALVVAASAVLVLLAGGGLMLGRRRLRPEG